MPRAIIQGEVHTSRSDKTAVTEQLAHVDALMRESIEQTREERWHPVYLLLFTGMKLFRNTVQRILYASDRPVFTLANDRDVAVHRIDISVGDWTTAIGTGKQLILLGLAGFMTYGTVAEIQPGWLQAVIGVIAFILLFFLYAALLTIPERDALMAENIIGLSETNQYDDVLVSVGDAHIPGIAEHLETAGWTVETYKSNTMFGDILRPFMHVLRRIS